MRHPRVVPHRPSWQTTAPPSNRSLAIGLGLLLGLVVALTGCVDERGPVGDTDVILTIPNLSIDDGWGFEAAAVGGRIYFAPITDQPQWFRSYRPSNRVLLNERLMPNTANDFAPVGWDGGFAVHAGQLYFIGNYAQIYVDRQWREIPYPVEHQRGGAATVSFEGELWAIGGNVDEAPLSDIRLYSGGTSGMWATSLSPAEHPWRVTRAVAVSHGQQLFVMGGQALSSTGSTIENRSITVYDARDDVWILAGELPAGADVSQGAGAIGGYVFVGVHLYDVARGTWSAMARPPLDVFKVVELDGQLYAVGQNGPHVEIHRFAEEL